MNYNISIIQKNGRSLKLLLTAFFLMSSSSLFAVFEVGGNYSYDRFVYGTNRNDATYERTYSGYIAKYLFNLTALEFNLSHSRSASIGHPDALIDGTSYKVTETRTDIETNTWGLGLRQSFAPREAFLVPMLSLGYARQISHSSGYLEFTNTTTGNSFISDNPTSKRSQNSVFATFTMKLKLTKFFSITGSANTVFPAFEFDRIRDNLKYSVGFSWMF